MEYGEVEKFGVPGVWISGHGVRRPFLVGDDGVHRRGGEATIFRGDSNLDAERSDPVVEVGDVLGKLGKGRSAHNLIGSKERRGGRCSALGQCCHHDVLIMKRIVMENPSE